MGSKLTKYVPVALLATTLITLGILLSCGGNSGNSISTPSLQTTGTVNTSITDPPTCSFMFDHIYVTITQVTANISADAGPDDGGSVTLVDLTSSPRQIDLLSLISTTCVLTQLGSTSGLQPGKFQQIRLFLLDNNPSSGTPTPTSNACGSTGFNCVVPHAGSPQTLKLSSEAQTGIKIPSSQITNGGLTVTAGQSSDLNIDFDSCASIVQEGNGSFRLKPVLHAGEVSVNNNSISGKVADRSGNPIGGAIVLLEQPDSNKVDRKRFSGMSASDGTFIFCPLPNPGGNATFDVVVAAETFTAGLVPTTYNATVAFNVPVGTNLNNIPLVSEGTPSLPGTISGQVTSAGSGGGTVADITLSVLQQLSGGAATQVTIPVFSAGSQPPVVTTTVTPIGPACPASTDCFNYSLLVPTSNPQAGIFTNGSINYSPAPGTLTYALEGVAPACTGVAPPDGTISSIAVSGHTTSVGTVLTFTGCTPPM